MTTRTPDAIGITGGVHSASSTRPKAATSALLDDTHPLACLAGMWTNWKSVRKVKEGETTNDLYAFLTTEPNAEVV